MNPGLVVKLRPTGPWRIGPDSGARNRVDFIYHSDSLYSAVTGAMARMGSLEEWIEATARASEPAVCFGSCFPFVEEIGFVVPPRTLWPPASPSALSARVRWRSARFVPLEVVHAILAGRPLNEDHWSVDGPSECLVPAGRSGPFRTALRWNAAVDRLTGAAERHATACLEFRPGCGLWTIVSFQDAAAYGRWIDPVKAAFRLLADSGFGGERSRGWGRTEAPEFSTGDLPDMLLPAVRPPEEQIATAVLPAEPEPPASEPEPETVGQASWPVVPAEEPPVEQASWPVFPTALPPGEPETLPPTPAPDTETDVSGGAASESAAVMVSSSIAVLEMEAEPEVAEAPVEPEPVLAPEAEEIVAAGPAPRAHWLLSLFTPAEGDAVDWTRGNYGVLARGGRVESAAGSGELKKQIQMIAEGSVVYAEAAPRGSAADVAPDGFAHPVYRAGFALTIPLPEAP